MFHSFFNSLARSRCLSFFSHFFTFILWSARTAKSTMLQVLFFLLSIIRSDLLAEIKWSVCMSNSHKSLCVLFSWTGVGLCIYHYFYIHYYLSFIIFILIMSICNLLNRLPGLVGRVFDNGPRDLGLIPGRVIPKTLKMLLDSSLLNTQQYKVRMKGKVE